MAECRKCKKNIGGLFGATKAYAMTIEEASKRGIDYDGLCQDCLQNLVDKAPADYLSETEKERFRSVASMIVSTTAHPAEWTKDIVGVVNGFSVIGTGPFTEFFSSYTDFWGAESNSYHEKLVTAKNHAITRMKEEAFALGANMVFGLQVTITEMTAARGMLLVAVTGTALNHKD